MQPQNYVFSLFYAPDINLKFAAHYIMMSFEARLYMNLHRNPRQKKSYGFIVEHIPYHLQLSHGLADSKYCVSRE